ncbi:putative adhesin [Enterobacter mori]|uniref:putative adhesin n=1 Tax=Enterobacter mori TaxID=539813 RepID=UPI003B842BF2
MRKEVDYCKISLKTHGKHINIYGPTLERGFRKAIIHVHGAFRVLQRVRQGNYRVPVPGGMKIYFYTSDREPLTSEDIAGTTSNTFFEAVSFATRKGYNDHYDLECVYTQGMTVKNLDLFNSSLSKAGRPATRSGFSYMPVNATGILRNIWYPPNRYGPGHWARTYDADDFTPDIIDLQHDTPFLLSEVLDTLKQNNIHYDELHFLCCRSNGIGFQNGPVFILPGHIGSRFWRPRIRWRRNTENT